MIDMMSNILRGSITSVMDVFLLFTLAKPKSGRCTTVIVATIVLVLNIASNIWFYKIGDLTALSRFDVVMFLVVGLALKPLTKSSFMQWCFNFITTINILMIIIILSFHLGKLFPNPQFAHTMLRLVFYIIVIILFQRFLLPLYQPVVNNWPVFSGLVICIFLNLSYYFYFTEDIEHTLLVNKWPLFLLVTLSLAAYSTVFYSLKKITAIYALETENLRIQNDAVLLSQAASTMAEKLELMDKVACQNSIASHDRRHFNSMILELLEQGELSEAVACLRRQNTIQSAPNRDYCENKAVNAAINYYVDMAHHRGIETRIHLTLPLDMGIDSLELALVVSNLFENAIHGVDLLPEGRERYIQVICLLQGRLMLEICNPCIDSVTLGEDGLPFSSQDGHGIGTKSICVFAKAHAAELLYHVENGLFRVRLLI